jgi:hypothetical protein
MRHVGMIETHGSSSQHGHVTNSISLDKQLTRYGATH